jgi:hypothetical protein
MNPNHPEAIEDGALLVIESRKPMTIADLVKHLEAIQDRSTPVYLETGEPVHYTCHGTSGNETKFFIGVL